MKNKPDISSYIKKAYRHFTIGIAVLILTVCAIAVTCCSGGCAPAPQLAFCF